MGITEWEDIKICYKKFHEEEMTRKGKEGRKLKCRLEPDEPDGYTAWHKWAEIMSKTHRQVLCEEHNLYHVWIPKARP
jgi:hypothetical protein